MKKSLLSIVALLAVSALSAQESETAGEGFKKGDAFLSGSVGYNTQKDDVSKSHVFKVSPAVGFFVTENIALGASLSYTSRKTDPVAPGVDTKSNSYGVGVFGRYYFTPANRFSFFGAVSAGYNNNKTESTGSPDLTGNGFGVQAGPGINYFISPRFSLQTSLGLLSYGSSKTKSGSAESTSTGFDASLDFSNLSFGLLYKL